MMNNQSTNNNDTTALKLGQLVLKVQKVSNIGGGIGVPNSLYPYARLVVWSDAAELVIVRACEAIPEHHDTMRINDEWIDDCNEALDVLAKVRREVYEVC